MSATPATAGRAKVVRRWRAEGGQGLVEAALAIPVLLVLIVGVVDLGRAVYQYNAVANAARELARVTSLHPGSPLGESTETLGVLAVQRGLVPSLGVTGYTCVDIAGTAVAGACQPGQWVRVSATSRFDPVHPVLLPFAPFDFAAEGSAEIQ